VLVHRRGALDAFEHGTPVSHGTVAVPHQLPCANPRRRPQHSRRMPLRSGTSLGTDRGRLRPNHRPSRRSPR
jgi:hypothetical protein